MKGYERSPYPRMVSEQQGGGEGGGVRGAHYLLCAVSNREWVGRERCSPSLTWAVSKGVFGVGVGGGGVEVAREWVGVGQWCEGSPYRQG